MGPAVFERFTHNIQEALLFIEIDLCEKCSVVEVRDGRRDNVTPNLLARQQPAKSNNVFSK